MSNKFIHKGKEFEIRQAEVGDEYVIRAYQENKVVIGAIYWVSKEVESDYRAQTGNSMVEEMKKTAQSDIERGIYIS